MIDCNITANYFAEKARLTKKHKLNGGTYICKLNCAECPLNSLNKEVSVGCAVDRVVCNVCGEDIAICTHKKGEVYGSKLCCGELVNPYDAYEWGFVASKADENESGGGA